MRIFNDAFTEAVVRADSVDIRFTIEVQWDEAGTELVYFLSHADSGAPVGATTIHSIHSVSSNSQSLNNRYAIAEIGSLSFMLADVGNAVTAELASRFNSGVTTVKKKCTVYMGTKELDWTDYEPIDTWFLDDINHTGPGYRFRASDVQRLLRQKIFTPDKSRLSASMSAIQTHIPLAVAISSTLFQAITHDSSYTFNPSVSVGYLKIDDEIIAHDGTFFNHATDGPSLGVLGGIDGRGALNTVRAAHSTDENADQDKGKEVTEIIYIEGPVVDIAHLVLTGQNVANTATIPDHWNAGISMDFIDSPSFADINNALSNRRLRFIGEKSQDAKQFVEQQCMRFYGLFQTVTSQGRLKLQRYERTIEETAPVAYASHNKNLLDISDLAQSSKSVINVYSINYNWDWTGERNTRNLTFLDASSYNANGRLIKNETFEFRGVTTALHSDNDIRNFIYQTRELYSNPPRETRIKVSRKLLGVEVGDVINVETEIRKDYISGSDKLNRPFLIKRRSVDLNSGEVTLDLVGNGLKADAILDPNAVGSVGELNDSWFTSEGTDLESLPNITGGTLTGDVTLTGTSDINASGSIWYIDGNLIIADGTTLYIENNVQLRVTGQIAIESGGSLIGEGRGLPGGVFGGMGITAGYLGTTKAGAGESQAPTSAWYQFPNNGGIILNGADQPPRLGKVQAVPFFNLRNEDGILTGLPSDLRGMPGAAGGASTHDNGGNGGNSGTGLITVSRGMSVDVNTIVDFSGDNGTAGGFTDVLTPAGLIRLYAGGGGGGCPGGWLCVIDGDFSAPTSSQITANRGAELNNNPRSFNRTGFESKDMAAAAYRLQYVPARKAIGDTGETGVRQLGTVTGVTKSGEKLFALADGTIVELAIVTWNALSDSAVAGYQVQAKRSSDPDWITQVLTNGQDDITAEVSVEGGVQYDVRVRAFGTDVIAGNWSATFQFIPVGKLADPSDVPWFTIDGNTLRWGAVTDGDLAGYLIKYRIGDNRNWSGAAQIHSGLLTSSPYTPATLPSGLITLMVKAVDRSGNESANAAVIVKTIGDPDISNIVLTQDEHADGFPGTIINGTVDNVTGDLEADSTTQIYSEPTDGQFYEDNIDSPFYAENVYAEMTYIFSIVPDQADEGATMTLEYSITPNAEIDFRNPFPFPMYDSNDSFPMYTNDADPMYMENGDWQPYTGPIAVSHDLYEFRIITPGGSIQGVISELKINIDAEDIVEKFNDIVISASGTRLPITKTYRQILNVTYGLQDDGGTAITAKTIDKDPSAGPLVNCRNASNVNVQGLVDAQIRGI